MFAGKKSAQIREILISESAWEEMTCLFAPSLVTSVQYTGADNGDTVGVTYAFQAAKVKQQYWEQSSSGGKGAETSAGWNIKENKEA